MNEPKPSPARAPRPRLTVFTYEPGDEEQILGLAPTPTDQPSTLLVRVAKCPAKPSGMSFGAGAPKQPEQQPVPEGVTLIELQPGQRVELGERWRDGVALSVRIVTRPCPGPDKKAPTSSSATPTLELPTDEPDIQADIFLDSADIAAPAAESGNGPLAGPVFDASLRAGR